MDRLPRQRPARRVGRGNPQRRPPPAVARHRRARGARQSGAGRKRDRGRHGGPASGAARPAHRPSAVARAPAGHRARRPVTRPGPAVRRHRGVSRWPGVRLEPARRPHAVEHAHRRHRGGAGTGGLHALRRHRERLAAAPRRRRREGGLAPPARGRRARGPGAHPGGDRRRHHSRYPVSGGRGEGRGDAAARSSRRGAGRAGARARRRPAVPRDHGGTMPYTARSRSPATPYSRWRATARSGSSRATVRRRAEPARSPSESWPRPARRR